MKFLVLAVVLVGSFAHAADPIPFVPMTFCKTNEKDLRAEWDKNRRVCFTTQGEPQSLLKFNGAVQTFKLAKMDEVKLRDNGQWVKNDYVTALSGNNELLEEIGSYNKYYVRYLSISKPVNGVMPFMVSIFFSWGAFGNGTQTMYVFGEITRDAVRLTGFSTPTDNDTWYSFAFPKLDSDIREKYNTAIEILTLNWVNPNEAGVKQTQDDDRKRSKGAAFVIQKLRESIQNKDVPTYIP